MKKIRESICVVINERGAEGYVRIEDLFFGGDLIRIYQD